MSDLIDKLLAVEKQARDVIARAEQEGAAAVERAREEARRIAAEGRETARREADELLRTVADKLDAQRQQQLERERARLPGADQLDPEHLDAATELILRAVARGE